MGDTSGTVPARPLDGVFVLDFSRVLAGPYCSMVLGDMGARIVKVEPLGSGDDTRQYGPFMGQESAYFMSINRNKESVALNLKSPEGLEAALKLAARADIVLENYRPGTMKRLGLGYEALREINPRLIYASVSGFGQDGPWKDKPAYDIIVQGLSGMMSITGHPGGPPTRVGISLGDIAAGLFATIGIVGALYERDRSGQGQMIDVAMLDAQLAILENAVARHLVTGEIPGPLGTRHPSITPFAAFPSSDGYILVGAGNDSLWRRLCESVGRPELVTDARFDTNRHRTENWSEIEPLLNDIFCRRTTDDWIEFLEARGIPCGPVNTMDKVVTNPQVQARGALVEVDAMGGGKLRMPRTPIKMSRTDPCVYRSAERLGGSTRSVLSEMGYSEQEIEAMVKSGAVEA
ncbi:MAG: CaiB/BaiF CoA-transferase family protein [Bacillota bacterium]